jgi:hypothetical protein
MLFWVTAATHRLVSGLFVVEALGPRLLKGITTPPEVFQVVLPTAVRGRLRRARSLTPFVGREEELRLLLSRWERTREGEGQLALLIGEPGIDKSRLMAEFHDRIREARISGWSTSSRSSPSSWHGADTWVVIVVTPRSANMF